MLVENAEIYREGFKLIEFPDFMEKFCPDLMPELQRKYWTEEENTPSTILGNWYDDSQTEQEKYWLLGWVTAGVTLLCRTLSFYYLLYYINVTASNRLTLSVKTILEQATEENKEAFRKGYKKIK